MSLLWSHHKNKSSHSHTHTHTHTLTHTWTSPHTHKTELTVSNIDKANLLSASLGLLVVWSLGWQVRVPNYFKCMPIIPPSCWPQTKPFLRHPPPPPAVYHSNPKQRQMWGKVWVTRTNQTKTFKESIRVSELAWNVLLQFSGQKHGNPSQMSTDDLRWI